MWIQKVLNVKSIRITGKICCSTFVLSWRFCRALKIWNIWSDFWLIKPKFSFYHNILQSSKILRRVRLILWIEYWTQIMLSGPGTKCHCWKLTCGFISILQMQLVMSEKNQMTQNSILLLGRPYCSFLLVLQ